MDDETAQRAIIGVAAWLQRAGSTGDRALVAAQELYLEAAQAYYDAGTPYGATWGGLVRWLDEELGLD